MFESCIEIRNHFSDYLDSQCARETFRSIRFHLAHCAACREELNHWQEMQAELRTLPRRHVPPQVGLVLRVRLSQEIHRNLLGRLLVHLENALEPLLLPASAGVLTAIICFGLIMGSEVAPTTNTPDAPVQIATPPRVRALAPLDFNTGDQAVVLDTHIDAGGRVLDYKVLSGQRSPELMYRLDRMMYLSVFHPATLFGKPTEGRVLLSLRRITVRG